MSPRRGIPVALLLAALVVYAGFWLARWRSARLIDFKSFYAAAVAARQGADLYDFKALNEAASSAGLQGYTFPYLYPPVLAHLAIPWGALAPKAAILFLLGLNLALLFPTLLLAGSDARARVSRWGEGRAPEAAYLFAAIALLALPFNDNLDMGQVNILILCLIVLCLWCVRTGREALGGFALGLASLIKVTPLLLLLYLLLRGRYKAAASAAATLLGVSAATLLMGAAPQWKSFFSALPSMSYGSKIAGLFPPSFFPNFSLAGFFARLLADDAPRVRMATVALLACLLGAAAWILRARREGPGADLMLLPFLVLMAVASPLTYVHHVVYVLPGLVLALTYAWSTLRGWRGAATAAALLLAAAVAGAPWPDHYGEWQLSPPADKLLTSLNLYGLLTLGLLGAALALRRAPEPSRDLDLFIRGR